MSAEDLANKVAQAATEGYQYVCPECGRTDTLHIAVRVMAKLYQDHEEDNFETEVYGDQEFDRDDYMRCSDCDFDGEVRDFEIVRPLPVKG